MKRKIIETAQAPRAIGPYHQAVQVDSLLFVSGQIALNPETGDVIPGGIREQTRQVLENLRAILNAAGGSLGNVVKTTVYLSNLDDFAAMNEVYAEYFAQQPPARATVEVSRLPKEVSIEIEAIAYI